MENEVISFESIFNYLSTSIGINIFELFRAIVNFTSSLRASGLMFKKIVDSLINASILLFYDVNPIRRIFNRLSSDQG